MSAAAYDLITVADMTAYGSIPGDATPQAIAATLISAASLALEREANTIFVKRNFTHDYPYDEFVTSPDNLTRLYLYLAPLVEIPVLTLPALNFVDPAGNAVAPELYSMFKEFGYLDGIFPTPVDANGFSSYYTITGKYGRFTGIVASPASDDIPQDVKEACRKTVAEWFRRKDLAGLAQDLTSDNTVFEQKYPLPLAAKMMLDDYRRAQL